MNVFAIVPPTIITTFFPILYIAPSFFFIPPPYMTPKAVFWVTILTFFFSAAGRVEGVFCNRKLAIKILSSQYISALQC